MIDLHTHTLFSDGTLLPSEIVCRAKKLGYIAIALTDHIDFSNMDFVVPRINSICKQLSKYYKLKVIPGAEITYVPIPLIAKAVQKVRKLGTKIVIVHGETLSEPVPPGTNKAGILSGCDILAHPGKISPENVALAAKYNVCLEITSRKAHKITNQHIYRLAKKYHTKMVFNTDAHQPEDLIDIKAIKKILSQANIAYDDFAQMQYNALKLIKY